MTVHHRLSVQWVFWCVFTSDGAPLCFCAAQSLFRLCLFIPVFISPRSPQSSSYLLKPPTHRCSSQLSPLLQVPISLFKSHTVISPEALAALSSDHGRYTLTGSDVVQQKSKLFILILFNLYFTVKVALRLKTSSSMESCRVLTLKFYCFCQWTQRDSP